MKKPLIIGQAPSRKSDPSKPLSGRSGRRLADLAGVPLEKFVETFDRMNLIEEYPGSSGKGDAFFAVQAQRRAIEIVRTGEILRPHVVLLGVNVALAFGLSGMKPLVWTERDGVAIAMCPHPSGVSLWWNDPEHVEEARAFWRKLAQESGLAPSPR